METDIVETAKEWPAVSRRLAIETDERKRAMLTELILHMVGEYILDRKDLADRLGELSIVEQRQALLDYGARFELGGFRTVSAA